MKTRNQKIFAVLLASVFCAGAALVGATHARADESVDLNYPELLTGFSAKETCSCAFVTGQTDEYCKVFGSQDGYAIDINIDRTAKLVSTTFISTTRTSHFVEGAGCALDN